MSKTTSKLLQGSSRKFGKWKKPNHLDHPQMVKEPGFRYRWVNPAQLSFIGGVDHRGWEVVRKGAGTSDETGPEEFTGNVTQFSRAALGSMSRAGDLVLARIPEEVAEERNQYYLEKALRLSENANDSKGQLSEDEKKNFYSEDEMKKLRPARGQIRMS